MLILTVSSVVLWAAWALLVAATVYVCMFVLCNYVRSTEYETAGCNLSARQIQLGTPNHHNATRLPLIRPQTIAKRPTTTQQQQDDQMVSTYVVV